MGGGVNLDGQDVLLPGIDGQGDLKALAPEQLPQLAEELRRCILRTVAANGGHLSSNLGVVELTIALLYSLDISTDSIIWDVSHQSYAHKILTGRREFFSTLRRFGGCCGFQAPSESPADPCFAGHAGTAISTALGISAAKLAKDEPGIAVAVVGDGALNCGLSFEALNNAHRGGGRLVIVLNDNRMSISRNVGALQSYLHRVITARHYAGVKNRIKRFIDPLPGHNGLLRAIRKLEGLTKAALLPGAVFEELGIRYLGPVDGHNLPLLLRTLAHVKGSDERPVLVHVLTRKGYGYAPAEKDPEAFHGVGKFDAETGNLPPLSPDAFSQAFGASMLELAGERPELAAVSAAMTYSTGLAAMQARWPERVWDVGIAEGHAVTFAAGLAAGGIRPVVAIYATFIQRALDNIFHDVCLGNLPVVFALDRAGLVEDGPTHNGIYDLGFLRELPNLTIMQPRDENELRAMLRFAVDLSAPVVVRYPRGGSGRRFDPAEPVDAIEYGRALTVRPGRDLAIWASGAEVDTALKVAEILEAAGVNAAVVNARFVKPLDVELLNAHAASMPVATIEDHSVRGGLGSAAEEALAGSGAKFMAFGWPDDVLPHGKVSELRKLCGMTPEAIAAEIRQSLL
ncbi:MAG: 1-deoxy-D-xylulose-5-phosphate synthase [Victivallaceae bacterium]|nr:1-deoxy-D-xylulose-5-phosphate synthase [Victivallaceae bacterium]